jgi:hypothetical protein
MIGVTIMLPSGLGKAKRKVIKKESVDLPPAI